MYKKIKTLNITDETKFDESVNELLDKGWIILSTYVSFVNSESYDFCTSHQAILALPK